MYLYRGRPITIFLGDIVTVLTKYFYHLQVWYCVALLNFVKPDIKPLPISSTLTVNFIG
jgi:hypothetical protein